MKLPWCVGQTDQKILQPTDRWKRIAAFSNLYTIGERKIASSQMIWLDGQKNRILYVFTTDSKSIVDVRGGGGDTIYVICQESKQRTVSIAMAAEAAVVDLKRR